MVHIYRQLHAALTTGQTGKSGNLQNSNGLGNLGALERVVISSFFIILRVNIRLKKNSVMAETAGQTGLF